MQENSSPMMGARTMGVLTERIIGEMKLLTESPWGVRRASRIIRVIGETFIQPIAIEVATVTADRGPKTDASNGRPTAAELGNPTVSAITELSAAPKCRRDRDQKKLIAYRVVYAIASTRAGAACARKSRI